MRFFQTAFLLALASGFVVWASGDGPGGANRSVPEAAPSVSPVLRSLEPADSGVVLLPGPAPVVRITAAPVREPAATKAIGAKAAIASNTTPPPDPDRPILRRAPRPLLPEELEKDSAAFCHTQIGQWTSAQAQTLLGVPKSQRPAYDERNAVNGEILAFFDPTGRYKQIELDFDGGTGQLRTVFAYPWKLTWLECRRTYGAKVSSAGANQGRMFYSYLDRRLDVLVDRSGAVISLGMY